MKNIVYLYTEIMPYQTIIFEQYSALGFEVSAFYLDKERQTPYFPPRIENVIYLPISLFSKNTLLEYVLEKKPVAIVVAGWFSPLYNYVSRAILKMNLCPVVCAIDTQYLKRLKQIIGMLASKFIIRSTFSHMWVPGPRQYEFARLLGYPRDRIIFNSLSGNVDLFKSASIEFKKKSYPKRFLYVGRFSNEKGLNLLIEAWDSISEKKGWTLTIVGNGPMEMEIKKKNNIEVIPFSEQERLVQIAEQSGCFILPSNYEPWALVLHEFAAAGIPIICSDACGAADVFVIHGYNGFIFKAKSSKEICNSISKIINMPVNELISLGQRSRDLSERITPQISAMSLLGILNNNSN